MRLARLANFPAGSGGPAFSGSAAGGASWFAWVGWAVENHGVDPDVEVTIAPHDWAAGRDPQLDTAVRLALQALEQRPPAAPPSPG